MAGQKLTDKSALANHTGTGDLYMIVDVSDTTGSTAGTSKKLDSKYVIQTDKISVSNAEFTAMDDSGSAGKFKTLIAAQGSGYMAVPLSVNIISTASDADNSNATLYLGWDASQTSNYWESLVRFMRGSTGTITNCFSPTALLAGNAATSIDDKPFLMYSSANFDSTDLAADVYVTYQVIKLS